MIASSDIVSAAGVRTPRILYGTAWKQTRTAALVAQAVEQGFRGIDTACQPKHYDEPGVGAGLASRLHDNTLTRGELYLQTKFTPLAGHDPQRVPYDPTARLDTQVAQSFLTSLRNLQTEYIDCLLLHSPLGEAKRTEQAWRAMELIFEVGGAKQLGISNCQSLETLSALYQTAKVKPAALQNRFLPDNGYDREIRAFCRSNGIVYQAFGALVGTATLLENPRFAKLAEEHGRTPEQILFRYLTQEDVVPLTGTTSRTHMKECLDIFQFELTARERAEVTALL